MFFYAHGSTADTGTSITGGEFYDPATARFPTEYQGKYFYADYCGGWIRYFDPVAGTSSPLASGIAKPVDLEVGDNGSLYYLSYGSNYAPASVHEIR